MSSPPPPKKTSFLMRMVRASLLHADTFEEVEADRSSIVQATLVVVGSCLAAVIGSWMRVAMGTPLPDGALPLEWHLALVGIEPMVTWLAGSAFAFMVGASFFRGPETETDYLEVLRTTGFAFTPGLFAGIVWLPPSGLGIVLVGLLRVWIVVASVVALRQALDFTTGRALGTYGVAVMLLWIVLWGLSIMPLPG